MAERFMVSTDSSGVFGRPEHWKEVWEPAIKHDRFAGFEAISWLWSPKLIERANKDGLNVRGFHGKTGNHLYTSSYSDRLIAKVIDIILMPTNNLIDKFGNAEGYVLVHEPEVKKHVECLVKKRNVINDLRIENHPTPYSLEYSYEMVLKLKNGGIKAGLMIDFVHLFKQLTKKGNNDSLEVTWGKVRKSVGDLFNLIDSNNDQIPVSFHLPLGLNMKDSLPVDLLTKEIFRDIAGITNRSGCVVVIENQQVGLNMIMTTEKTRKRQKERNEGLLDKLVKYNII